MLKDTLRKHRLELSQRKNNIASHLRTQTKLIEYIVAEETHKNHEDNSKKHDALFERESQVQRQKLSRLDELRRLSSSQREAAEAKSCELKKEREHQRAQQAQKNEKMREQLFANLEKRKRAIEQLRETAGSVRAQQQSSELEQRQQQQETMNREAAVQRREAHIEELQRRERQKKARLEEMTSSAKRRRDLAAGTIFLAQHEKESQLYEWRLAADERELNFERLLEAREARRRAQIEERQLEMKKITQIANEKCEEEKMKRRADREKEKQNQAAKKKYFVQEHALQNKHHRTVLQEEIDVRKLEVARSELTVLEEKLHDREEKQRFAEVDTKTRMTLVGKEKKDYFLKRGLALEAEALWRIEAGVRKMQEACEEKQLDVKKNSRVGGMLFKTSSWTQAQEPVNNLRRQRRPETPSSMSSY